MNNKGFPFNIVCNELDSFLPSRAIPDINLAIEEMREERKLPVSVFASEALLNRLVKHNSPYQLTEEAHGLIRDFKGEFTPEFIENQIMHSLRGTFPLLYDKLLPKMMAIFWTLIDEKVFIKETIEKKASEKLIRPATFLFLLVIYGVTKATEERFMVWVKQVSAVSTNQD
ncbi:MAG: hypothetical protein QME42_11315 [bacterium]|nr:hypothetical protein [bacterium]